MARRPSWVTRRAGAWARFDSRLSEPSYERNIRLYGWIRLFAKRVYLPLISIYLIEVGGLKLSQIGLLVTLSAISSILADIPSGYFADRVRRQTAMIVGAVLITVASAIFVLAPFFLGAAVATVLTFVGYSFINGAGEALMHDTLEAMGRIQDYVRVMGRAQSFGLVGNIALVGLVPLTYAIDKRLPFILGTLAGIAFVAVIMALKEQPLVTPVHRPAVIAGLLAGLGSFVNRRTVLVFAAIGLISAIYIVFANLNTIIYKDLGLAPSLMGFVFAASSLVGAVGGWFIHRLQSIQLGWYALLDAAVATGTLIAIGVTHNLWVAVTAGLLNLGFYRLRGIIYQDQLLRRFHAAGHKATLISALSFFENLNQIWLPYAMVAATAGLGYYRGFTLVGALGFAVCALVLAAGMVLLRREVAPSPKSFD